jgi:hypothetical protein
VTATKLTGEEACTKQHVWPPTWQSGDTCNCGGFYLFTDGAMSWMEETARESMPFALDAIDKDLELRLRESLARRAQQLAKMSLEKNCPRSVLSLFACNVVTMATLLLGDHFARWVFEKFVTALRETNGICMCGEREKAPNKPLCQQCWDGVEEHDKELEEYSKMRQRVKGRPS